MMQLARHPFLLFFLLMFSFFSLSSLFRAGILERANESEVVNERGGEEIHKGLVINAQATITTKTLKGEKTCFCVKQLVLQH